MDLDKETVTDETVFDFKPMSSVTMQRGKRRKSRRNSSVTELPYSASKENEAGAGTAKRRRYSSTTGGSGAIVPTEIGVNCNERHDAAGGVTGPKVMKASRIPRYEGLLNKSKASTLVTLNRLDFKKLHEVQLRKMESIDSYHQRKQKRLKDLTTLREKTSLNPRKNLKPPPGPESLFGPALSKPADDKRRHIASASKPVLKGDAPFRPSVLSTHRINEILFSWSWFSHKHQGTLPWASTPLAGTFVFMGNLSVSGKNNKPIFDLKKSLSRPLTYTPHKGKLKPFGENRENAAGNDSQRLHSHQNKYKRHQVQTRESRRERHVKDRKQKKEDLLGTRRRLTITLS